MGKSLTSLRLSNVITSKESCMHVFLSQHQIILLDNRKYITVSHKSLCTCDIKTVTFACQSN